MTTGSAGCNKSQADIDASINTTLREMMIKRTPQQRAIEALQTENADERRKALRDVLRDKQATAEWAVKVFASVAKTDPDPQVRCIAIKGLKKSADERVTEPLLMILNYKEYPQKVVPPPPEVRWDATEVISYMSDFGGIPGEHWDWAQRTLVRLVTDERDRNVRIEAAQGLGNFPHRSALDALIRALEDRDFAVRDAAEKSLQRLTGEHHDYDADAWREWLAKTQQPFIALDEEEAFFQEVPSAEPAKKNLWQRTMEGTRELFMMWQGEAKESSK